MTAEINTLRGVLRSLDWDPRHIEETGGFVVDFDPPYVPIAHAYAAIAEEPELFLFYLNVGVRVSQERKDEVACFLTRVNSDLMNGNFDMDYEDGMVRFRSSVGFAGTELSEHLIRNVILFAMNAVEKYAEPLIDVIARGKGAEQAFQEANAAPE